MRLFALVAIVLPLLAGCSGARPRPPRPSGRVLTGLDVLERDGFAQLRGKRIGLITNHTGKDARGRTTVEVLASAPGVELVSLFSPEHGFFGVSEANRIASSTITVAGKTLPVYSLYSGTTVEEMRPKPEELEGLDALVFDVQDIGARFYTYLTTMGLTMEEAKKAGLSYYVLDRPNPINGVVVEGPILDDLSLRKVSATTYFPIAVRHGMTAGEVAAFHNAEVKLDLHVIKLEGWKREMWYDETGLPWIAPSPNMPDLDAATLYPGIAIFEASNLSVGRGTPWPFRWVGAPWLDGEKVAAEMNAALLDGVRFTAERRKPTKSVFKDEDCGGVRIEITDRDRLRPLAVFRALNAILRREYPDRFVWRWNEAKRMVGTERFQRLDERGLDPVQVKALFDEGAERFEAQRKPFLLY